LSIAGFAAYVDTCSPASMRIHSKPIKEAVKATAAILERQGLILPSPPSLGGKMLTELLTSGEVIMSIDPKYPQSMGIQSIEQRVAVWGNSRWDILLNDHADTPYFTSEYPVAVEMSDDPRVLYRLVPLSPTLAIRIRPDLRHDNTTDLSFKGLRSSLVKATRQEVIHINTAIVQCAETTVYSSHDKAWVRNVIARNKDLRIEPVTVKTPYEKGHMHISTLRILPSTAG
jgi:hypothetical protein